MGRTFPPNYPIWNLLLSTEPLLPQSGNTPGEPDHKIPALHTEQGELGNTRAPPLKMSWARPQGPTQRDLSL